MIENRQVRRQNSDCSSCYYSVGKNERIQRVRSHAGQAECASLQKQKEEYKTSVDTCNKLMAQKNYLYSQTLQSLIQHSFVHRNSNSVAYATAKKRKKRN